MSPKLRPLSGSEGRDRADPWGSWSFAGGVLLLVAFALVALGRGQWLNGITGIVLLCTLIYARRRRSKRS